MQTFASSQNFTAIPLCKQHKTGSHGVHQEHLEELKTLIKDAIGKKPKGHTLGEEGRHKGRPFSQVGG